MYSIEKRNDVLVVKDELGSYVITCDFNRMVCLVSQHLKQDCITTLIDLGVEPNVIGVISCMRKVVC